jgi:uncharacterized protein YjbI with pentapeptide repeats
LLRARGRERLLGGFDVLAINLTTTPVLVLVAAGAVAALCAVWWIPRRQARRWRESGIHGKALADLENSARGTIVQILGGVALILTFAATWTQIEDTRRATNDTLNLTREQQETQRFTEAVAELDSKALEERLGGIYGLDRVASEDAASQRTIEQILIAWIDRPAALPRPKARATTTTECLQSQPAKEDTQAALGVVLSFEHSLGGKIDLTGADLRGVDLSNENLQMLTLTKTQLAGAQLVHSLLDGVSLDHACLNSADLQAGQMKGADLRGSHLNLANLAHANLIGADLTGAVASGADLDEANLRNAFPPSVLTGATVEYADLRFYLYPGLENIVRSLLAGLDTSCARLPWRPRQAQSCHPGTVVSLKPK